MSNNIPVSVTFTLDNDTVDVSHSHLYNKLNPEFINIKHNVSQIF